MKNVIQITFHSDRALTASERDDLANAIAVQIEEPQIRNYDDVELDLFVDAEYSTSQIVIDFL